jgi:natural product precursor
MDNKTIILTYKINYIKMKNLNKIKLNKLSSEKMTNRDLGMLRGGGDNGDCVCGCRYSNDGGSSNADNGNANNAGGYQTEGGGTFYP